MQFIPDAVRPKSATSQSSRAMAVRAKATGRFLGFGLSAALFATMAMVGGPAEAESPRFEDYSERVYKRAPRAPRLSSHPDAKTYRTRLRNGVKGGVNFAGDHVIVTWGCGAQCLMGAVVNARSGHVQFLPGTICCWFEGGDDINPIDYKADSNLLILTGFLNEEEPLARRYYDFTEREFKLIKTEPLKAGGTDTGSDAGGGTTKSARLDVCYYDKNFRQVDADWCKTGGDLSDPKTMHLKAYCGRRAEAACELGSSGYCRRGAPKYTFYAVMPHRSGRCPATYREAVVKSEAANPMVKLLVCYYNRNGRQHDADACRKDGDISKRLNVQLDPRCGRDAGATCAVGNNGQCRQRGSNYATYVVFPYDSGRCPSTYGAALAAIEEREEAAGGDDDGRADDGRGDDGGTDGGMGSGGNAGMAGGDDKGDDGIPDTVKPTCPDGFTFTQGQCVRDRTTTKPKSGSSCVGQGCDSN